MAKKWGAQQAIWSLDPLAVRRGPLRAFAHLVDTEGIQAKGQKYRFWPFYIFAGWRGRSRTADPYRVKVVLYP